MRVECCRSCANSAGMDLGDVRQRLAHRATDGEARGSVLTLRGGASRHMARQHEVVGALGCLCYSCAPCSRNGRTSRSPTHRRIAVAWAWGLRQHRRVRPTPLNAAIVHSNGASRDTAGSTRRRGSPAGISISGWRSPSSRTAKACVISKRVCAPCSRSSIYHLGIRARLARSTIADGNETRDWQIYADFAHGLIRAVRRLYVDEPLAVDLADTVYALDASVLPRREPAWRAQSSRAKAGGPDVERCARCNG